MPEPIQAALSDAERNVLLVLWEKGALGVREVLSHLDAQGQDWTRSTVVTLLHRLEVKGYVDCDRAGYAFVYRPVVTREDVMHARMAELAGELADGQPVPLMLAFVERHRFSDEELARLQKMIDDLKRRSRKR